jgi:hypothetical protein
MKCPMCDGEEFSELDEWHYTICQKCLRKFFVNPKTDHLIYSGVRYFKEKDDSGHRKTG